MPNRSSLGYKQALLKKPRPDPFVRQLERLQRTLERKKMSRVKAYLRTKVWRWIFKGEHRLSASSLVGCSKPDFIHHIASQFKRGMSWSNYAKVWEFDHIVPCSKFNLYDPADRARCFHFSNYRPDFIRSNRTKAGRVIPCQPELLLVSTTNNGRADRACQGTPPVGPNRAHSRDLLQARTPESQAPRASGRIEYPALPIAPVRTP